MEAAIETGHFPIAIYTNPLGTFFHRCWNQKLQTSNLSRQRGEEREFEKTILAQGVPFPHLHQSCEWLVNTSNWVKQHPHGAVYNSSIKTELFLSKERNKRFATGDKSHRKKYYCFSVATNLRKPARPLRPHEAEGSIYQALALLEAKKLFFKGNENQAVLLLSVRG